MTATPETLRRHEFIGRSVSIVEATDPTLVGRSGTVVDETKHTLSIETDRTPALQVPKRGSRFEFTLDASTACSEGCRVRIEGSVIEADPARRSELQRRSLWH